MKRKNKPIRRQDTVQPLPLPADAGEIAFAHGVSRRVVVVDAAESPLFEQIIYIVRDDAACGSITAADLVQQARDAVGRVPPTPAPRPQQKTCTGLLIWLCSIAGVLAAGILLALAPLIGFKYLDFLTKSVLSVLAHLGVQIAPPAFDFLLPMGISFYTLQAVGYLVDTYGV